ncbi:alpha/beta hydrolase [Ruegeria atlantica]|uniref:alpha/beta hydrolase n=1 Tax=Ruegeria atlantica TaxID=81569 RepID=UPI00147E2E2F|nr:alpha/beta fold hydrolase [Ruegeria atlantica]
MKPQTFVLVHGLWHGGWCWSRVAEILRKRGYRVETPTNTGVGERSHLLTKDITLATFVEDIVQHVHFEQLQDVVLVGHSFGGATVTGVADRIANKIAKLIYLDGAILESGETWLGLLAPEIAKARSDMAQSSSGGLTLPPAKPGAMGVIKDEDVAFIKDRLTPHPFATMTTALRLDRPAGDGMDVHYIQCADPSYPPANLALVRAQQKNWPITQIATGHDAMVLAPLLVADELDRIASSETQPSCS